MTEDHFAIYLQAASTLASLDGNLANEVRSSAKDHAKEMASLRQSAKKELEALNRHDGLVRLSDADVRASLRRVDMESHLPSKARSDAPATSEDPSLAGAQAAVAAAADKVRMLVEQEVRRRGSHQADIKRRNSIQRQTIAFIASLALVSVGYFIVGSPYEETPTRPTETSEQAVPAKKEKQVTQKKPHKKTSRNKQPRRKNVRAR